jgi:two-component system sensor histidine kinase KdpD
MVGEIQEAAARLNRLVGNLLDITRLETGHVKPKLDWCDVNDLVHIAVQETAGELARHQVTVMVAPGLPLVRMDFVLMQQSLMNLLHNAAVHTPAGTPVEVSAFVEKDNLLLTVADRGPGLPPEAIERVFDKFYRAPAARAGGTGLGLSIVKGVVGAQGGQCTAANRPGGGAAFAISLPMGMPPPMSAEILS